MKHGTIPTSGTYNVLPVPDEPPVTLPSGGELEIAPGVATFLNLGLDVSLDDDGSEEHFLDISELPIDSRLSAGTNVLNDGTLWRVAIADVSGLMLILPAGTMPGTITISVAAFTRDNGVNDSREMFWNAQSLILNVVRTGVGSTVVTIEPVDGS